MFFSSKEILEFLINLILVLIDIWCDGQNQITEPTSLQKKK